MVARVEVDGGMGSQTMGGGADSIEAMKVGYNTDEMDGSRGGMVGMGRKDGTGTVGAAYVR